MNGPEQLPAGQNPRPVTAATTWPIILWIVLLLLVALIACLEHQPPEQVKPLTESLSTHDSFELRLIGQYAVAANRLSQTHLTASGNGLNLLLDHIENLAHSPLDQLRAVTLYSEIAGAEMAVRRLDELMEGGELNADSLPGAAILHDIYNDQGRPLSGEQRQQLIAQHGWFGKLAISFRLPDDDPLRKQAMEPAINKMILLLLMGTLIILAGLAGTTLFIVAIVLLCTGKVHRAYQCRPGQKDQRRYVYLEVAAIYLAAVMGLGLLRDFIQLRFAMNPTWLMLLIVLGIPCWPLLRRTTWRQLQQDLGWQRGRGIWREVGAGCVGYLAGLPILAAGLVIFVVLITFSNKTPTHPIMHELFNAHGWRVVSLLALAAVWAPVTEETIFRGALYHYLRGWARPVTASVVVGVLFAAIHPQGYVAIPALTAIAVVFALIREWRGSIIGSAVAHSLHNSMAVVLFFLLTR